MNDLEINGKLITMIADNKDTKTTMTGFESLLESVPEVGLVDDCKGLLDIAGLGHGNDSVILNIENTILLEDRTRHGLNNNTWAGMGDVRRLFMQLSGEEIDTQVSVLTSSRGGGNANDLAWTTLKDDNITKTDMVAGDRDGIRSSLGFAGHSDTFFIIDSHLVKLGRRMNNFFSYVDLFVLRVVSMRWVDSGVLDTDFFTEDGSRVRFLDSGLVDMVFFTGGRSRLGMTWLDCGFVDSNFVTVAWLISRPI